MKSENLYEFGFRNRLDAMTGMAGIWAKEFGNDSDIARLLNQFSHFACSYYNAIEHAATETDSPDVFDTALNRLQREWVTISQACQQRKVTQLQGILETADNQAEMFYSRFIGFWLNGQLVSEQARVKPITYFEKVYAITRYVFTSFPLISIPFQYLHKPDQWQALAHEMGHYLYWNGCSLERFEELQTQLQATVKTAVQATLKTESYDDVLKSETLVNIWSHWLEEMVADIIGVLLNGSSYVASSIRLAHQATNFDVGRLTYDDGEHPSWYIRPFIAMETLKWMSRNEKAANDFVINQGMWEQRLAEVQAQQGRLVHQSSGISFDEIRNQVPAVVTALLETGVRLGHCFKGIPTDMGVMSQAASNFIAQLVELAKDFYNNPQSEAFDSLRAFLRTKAETELNEKGYGDAQNKHEMIEQAVHHALLTLQWSNEEQFDNGECGWRKVARQNGVWVLC